MSVSVEKLEHNMAKLTVEVSVEDFEKAVERVYRREKNNINVPGFRKGKAPRQLIEKMYGKEVFFREAADEVISESYESAYDECGEEIVSAPAIEVVQLEAGQPFIYTAEVALRPPVELGEYMGIEIEKPDTEVSDEEIDAELQRERERNSRSISITDRPVEDGDEIVLDFEGFVDGVPFQGGKGENYSLTIGSGQFIPGFEEQLVGKALEEECEINVTFPEDYHSEELKGKAAVFKCTVHEIKQKELPELDDEFASEVSEFDTLEEYRASVKSTISDRKEKEAASAKEEAVIKAVVENASMDIPDAMVDTEVNSMLREFANRIQMQGMSIEQYMQFTGSSAEAMREQFKPRALERIKSGLVLKAIADKEGFAASEEDFDAECAKMAETYGMEIEDLKKSLGEAGKANVMEDIVVNKAIDMIVTGAKEK